MSFRDVRAFKITTINPICQHRKELVGSQVSTLNDSQTMIKECNPNAIIRNLEICMENNNLSFGDEEIKTELLSKPSTMLRTESVTLVHCGHCCTVHLGSLSFEQVLVSDAVYEKLYSFKNHHFNYFILMDLFKFNGEFPLNKWTLSFDIANYLESTPTAVIASDGAFVSN
ncbi:hypothetical protein ACTA71_004005 [Dictyostelium dimigraforme]